MRNDIVEKLKGVVSNKDYSEQEVVYFFVESYKLLEQINRLSEYPVIKFYRNWICHSSLTKDADRIFEEVYIILRAEKYFSFPPQEEDEPPAFVELLHNAYQKAFREYFFPKLREEIKKFGGEFLDNKIPKWEPFRENLYQVLIDTPLLIKKGNEELFQA